VANLSWGHGVCLRPSRLNGALMFKSAVAKWNKRWQTEVSA